MANAIVTQTIHDGPRNLVVKVDITGDASGEETATKLIDVSTYNGAPDNVKIMSIDGELTGFSIELLWDATTDVVAQNVPAGDVDLDYGRIGGLVNNAGTGVTGDIMFTTVGLGAADKGTLVMSMRKRDAP